MFKDRYSWQQGSNKVEILSAAKLNDIFEQEEVNKVIDFSKMFSSLADCSLCVDVLLT